MRGQVEGTHSVHISSGGRSADSDTWSQLLQSVQCANVGDTNYLTGNKPAPVHTILTSILVSGMALKFTMHAAVNGLILVCRYCGSSAVTTATFLPLPRYYRRFLTVTAGLP